MGLAYQGRVGVFEVMAIDDEARQYIIKDDIQHLRAHLRKKKMLWLQEAALHKVVQGVTDIKEITRVIGGSAGGAAQQAQAKQTQAKQRFRATTKAATAATGARPKNPRNRTVSG